MDVIGIKSATLQARLVREFFLHLVSPAHYKKQIRIFVPKGMAHLLGADNYTRTICKNNQFIHSIITILVSGFQHATLDLPFSTDPTTDIEQMTLLELISELPWCISVEKTMIDMKVLITTMKPHLEHARKWIDHILPDLYWQHIDDKIDVTMLHHLIPWHLNRPVLMEVSTAYADKMKQCTMNLTPATTPPNNLQNLHALEKHCMLI